MAVINEVVVGSNITYVKAEGSVFQCSVLSTQGSRLTAHGPPVAGHFVTLCGTEQNGAETQKIAQASQGIPTAYCHKATLCIMTSHVRRVFSVQP